MYGVNDFPALLQMSPISLSEMSAVSLMNRTDTKFVTSADRLAILLVQAKDAGYRVCQIAGERLMSYESVYYDTEGLDMFTAHRNKKMVRQKVRVRRYMTTGQTFLEIKRKNNHARTKKKRLLIPSDCIMCLNKAAEAPQFIENRTVWRLENLMPETTTDFDRITLVDGNLTERITIDLNLSFDNLRNGNSVSLGPIVIIELKQDGSMHSRFRDILLRNRIFPYRISKYCIAVSLTEPSARIGRFKEKIRYIEKITERKLI